MGLELNSPEVLALAMAERDVLATPSESDIASATPAPAAAGRAAGAVRAAEEVEKLRIVLQAKADEIARGREAAVSDLRTLYDDVAAEAAAARKAFEEVARDHAVQVAERGERRRKRIVTSIRWTPAVVGPLAWLALEQFGQNSPPTLVLLTVVWFALNWFGGRKFAELLDQKRPVEHTRIWPYATTLVVTGLLAPFASSLAIIGVLAALVVGVIILLFMLLG